MTAVRNLTPITCLVLGIVLAITVHRTIASMQIIPEPITIFGIVPIILGIALFACAVSCFARKKTDIRPGGVPTAFIQSGPYRYTRNPIYMANMLVLLGVCILLGSLLPFITIPLYFIIIRIVIVPFEEKRLESIFGREYVDYKKRVRRWL